MEDEADGELLGATSLDTYGATGSNPFVQVTGDATALQRMTGKRITNSTRLVLNLEQCRFQGRPDYLPVPGSEAMAGPWDPTVNGAAPAMAETSLSEDPVRRQYADNWVLNRKLRRRKQVRAVRPSPAPCQGNGTGTGVTLPSPHNPTPS